VRRIVDERGELRRFVNVYVGDVDVRDRDGLATTIPDGSTVLVLPSVAGG
jgi:molybdopterin converting factor small subunit